MSKTKHFEVGQKVFITDVIMPDELEPHPRAGQTATVHSKWIGDMVTIRTESGRLESIFTARLALA